MRPVNKLKINTYYGWAIITGSILMIITMALHPAGGSISHILQYALFIKGTHALAIFSIPVLVYGFYGFTVYLKRHSPIAVPAFIIFSFGMIAAVFAAALNGIVLPIFLERMNEIAESKNLFTNTFITYNTTLNNVFDYIFIACTCLSSFGWSASVVITGKLPKWLGYSGLVLSITVTLLFIFGMNLISLTGFSILIFCYAIWTIAAGTMLLRRKP